MLASLKLLVKDSSLAMAREDSQVKFLATE